jgi:hypothetical protein
LTAPQSSFFPSAYGQHADYAVENIGRHHAMPYVGFEGRFVWKYKLFHREMLPAEQQ